MLGPKGTINIPFDSPLVDFGQLAFVPAPVAYGLAILSAVAVGVGGFLRARVPPTGRVCPRPRSA